MRKGFTLIEIVSVLVVMGVLAFAAVSVFRNDGMAAYAERDKLLSHLIYARAQGMAMGGGQCVAVSGKEVSFPLASAVSDNHLPAGLLVPYSVAKGVTVTPFKVCFDALGSACGQPTVSEGTGLLYCSGGADMDIGFGDNLSLRVFAATGFVQ